MPNNLESKLKRNKAVVVHTFPDSDVLNTIKQHIKQQISLGGRIVFLVNEIDEERHDFTVFYEEFCFSDSIDLEMILVCTINEFINRINNRHFQTWISEIALLITPEAEIIFRDTNTWEMAFYLLQNKLLEHDMVDFPQAIFLFEPRHTTEENLKESIPLYDDMKNQTNEINLWGIHHVKSQTNKQHWWTVWTSKQSEDYKNKLIENQSPNNSVGILAPLAQFAGRWGLENQQNIVFYTNNSGEQDRLENMQYEVQKIHFSSEKKVSWRTLAESADFNGCISIYSNKGKAWSTLKKITNIYKDNLIITNVVAKQNMLLDYLLDNAIIYAEKPIASFSPRKVRDNPYNIVLRVLQKIDLLGSLQLDLITKSLNVFLRRDQSANQDEFSTLKHYVEMYFGQHLAEHLKLKRQTEWCKIEKTYTNKCYVYFSTSSFETDIPWLGKYHVKDGNNFFDTLLADHIYQTYWPGKKVFFCGKVFQVDSIDHYDKTINISHDRNQGLTDYRVEKKVQVHSQHTVVFDRYNKQYSLGDFTIEKTIMELDFSVSSSRYVASNNHWLKQPFVFNNLNVPKRRYQFGRATRIQIYHKGTNYSALTAGEALAFSAMINEMAKTLLPEVEEFIIATAHIDASDRPSSEVADICIPEMLPFDKKDVGSNGQHQHLQNLDNRDNSIWIFEDSHIDLGICREVYESFKTLVDIAYDWLDWFLLDNHNHVTGTNQQNQPVCKNNIQQATDWFAFGESYRDAAIDLTWLKKTLHQVFDGFGIFRTKQNREDLLKNSSVTYLQGNQPLSYQCDICAKEVNEASNTMSDGRIICADCLEIGVFNQNEVDNMLKDLSEPFYNTVHGIPAFNNVQIKLVNQTSISQECNQKFIATSSFDPRAIGLAVRSASKYLSDSNKSLVLIESGHSKERTSSTLVHELCHIWQFQNLNWSKLENDYDDYLIEGHAVWTQDSYMTYCTENLSSLQQLNKEQLNICIEKLNYRKEIEEGKYGDGYRLLVSKINKTSAFKWLKTHYPKKPS